MALKLSISWATSPPAWLATSTPNSPRPMASACLAISLTGRMIIRPISSATRIATRTTTPAAINALVTSGLAAAATLALVIDCSTASWEPIRA